MAEESKTPDDQGKGGRILDWVYRNLAGPATVDNAVHGGSQEAREQWKRDLENRKQWSREQRERKRAEREARRGR
ncbi:hypothetical protein [Micromonospora inositola]|uniref:Uncharacterized protein n=1 Tax=Micromonospora inositola TaxID=47865 RepID=A0A1C5HKI6_9ACTN|nr:hypothetical protein [Micromonospora inositola]SCG46091.1 hypothetical protein GA0070613_1412 [Micromonospora inositola]